MLALVEPIAPSPPAPKRPSPASESRIPELDGFRAIAALAVLVTHALFAFGRFEGALDGIPGPIITILSKGWLGVDLFFVLSGLLISGILIDSREKPHYFRNFYLRRVLRIMPLYFVTLAVSWYFYGSTYSGFFLFTMFFMANYASAFGVPLPHGPGVYWSLAVEEHFYLIWPLGARFLSRHALAFSALAIWVGTPLLRGWAAATHWATTDQIYEFSQFRFDGLALGALLAIWWRSPLQTRQRSLQLAAGMLAFAVVMTVVGLPFGILGTKTVASTALRYSQVQLLFGSAILTALTLRGSALTAVLRSGFLRVTSDYSYCIYMVHLSLGDAYMWLLKQTGVDMLAKFGPRLALGIQVVAIIGGTYLLAAISKRFLEDPFLRLKHRFA